MRKRNLGKRIAIFLLALIMASSTAVAAVGDLSNVETGLTGDIDTADTISLPIKIMDYEADGMLFEYAEAYAGVSGTAAAKTATDFGATWCEDYTTRTTVGGSVNTGNYWSDVTLALKTGTYANYTRATWAGNTTANWTGNRAGVVLADFSESSTYTTDQLRYMVVVFRSNVRSGNFTVGINCSKTNGAGSTGNYTGNIAVTTESNTYWTYAVLDLKTGSLGSNWSTRGYVYGMYVGLPIDASGEWMDIAHVAYFSDVEQATAFGEYALTDGSDRGDNRAFGLLRSSRTQSGGTNYTGIIDATDSIGQLNTYTDKPAVDFSTLETLGYTLLGTFATNGIANVGLLESTLSAEGYPVYKEEVVDYLAGLLKHSLEITERTSDGWKNYRYVKGTASSVYGGTDLATALRTKINGTTGSYAAASAKDLVGTWSDVGGNIASYYDAAYFLLNSIFVNGSYNELQDDYDYLVLSAGTDAATGDKVYVFDGGFATSSTPSSASSAVKYDETNNTIQNTTAAGKSHFVYEGSNTTTLNPFLPITGKNTASGQTVNPYYQDDGVINAIKKQTTKDTLYQRNYNFAMVSEGEFVYHADDELFFEFEGDDDVYLFINDELVMDIGSAHSIDGVRFELNDYVNAAKAGTLGSDARNKALALEEGNTYSFKFYYMERHSYGSNIRICTNIKVTDPSMTTAKTAWQNGTQLDFGSIVDPYEVVEYGFGITNNGEENLYNLTFTDNDIGVTLDPTNGLTVTGSRVYDVNGGTLEASDLTAVVSHPDYDDITVTFADNAALKAFLATLASDAVVENGGGLWSKSTVQIRGIGYKLSEDQIKAGVFDNTVFTTSTNKTESKKLQGQASMRVFVPADPMYYEWAGHDLTVTKTKLITDILAAANQTDNILNGKVSNLTTDNVNKIELVTKAGNAISSSNVTIDSSYDLTINYDKTGSNVFYVKITYNSSKNTVIVPVLVNVTDVKDSVYVLDYGLKADLIENDELFKNDTITVPGRTTTSSILALGSSGAYSPNEITFTSDSDGVLDGDSYSGTYTLSDQKITFAPTKFMEQVDTFQIAMNVYESDITPSKIAGTLDINNEVEMYKSVSVLPANVVYYEDNFPAITYTTAQEPQTNSFVVVGTQQSVDQTQEYGQDEVYQNNSDMSGNSITTVVITSSDTVASFEFTGTGFELVGRTNAYDSATLAVTVTRACGANETPNFDSDNDDTNDCILVKRIPVITEFDNNNDGGTEEIYQVPVIKVENLTYGTYKVAISGIPARDFNNVDANGEPAIVPTNLYIDGLRIYQPLGATNENYLATENGAQFIEIREQILDGKVAVSEWTGTDLSVSSGLLTWTENYDGSKENYEGSDVAEGSAYYEFVANEVDSPNEYLLEGPNNEVYMMGDYLDSALLLYVKETDADTHNLQIGVHAVDEGLFVGTTETGMNSTIKYGINTGTEELPVYAWVTLDTVTSATEQYYTIDYTKCPYSMVTDEDSGEEIKRYQVVVLVGNGMVSFTNLKMNGLELDTMSETSATALRFTNGVILGTDDTGTDVDVSPADVPAFLSLRSMMMSLDVEDDVTDDTTSEEGEDVTTPEDSEETTTPEEGGDDTTLEEGEDATTPEEGSDDTTSEDSKKPTKPEQNGNSSKPTKPSQNGNASKPEQDETDLLPEEDEDAVPDAGENDNVPEVDEGVTTPDKDSSESTGVWDWIMGLINGILKFFGGVFGR